VSNDTFPLFSSVTNLPIRDSMTGRARKILAGSGRPTARSRFARLGTRAEVTTKRLRLTHEQGFTIVEVMVAMLLLAIGVLGTVRLINGANAATVISRDRVSGLNLARDVAEAARAVEYGDLTCANGQAACTLSDLAVTTLQGEPGLGSSSAGAWTVARSGITYTIGVQVCKVDESKDGLGANDAADGTFCAAYTCPTATVTNCGDKNPDDYRRLDVTVTWPNGSGIVGKHSVRQVALLSNPSGGLGPAIKLGPCVTNPAPTSGTTACPATPITHIREAARPACDGTHGTPSNPAACASPTPTCSGNPCVPIWLTTSSNDTGAVHWSADDGTSEGDATALSGTTKWGITWPLGVVDTSVVDPFTTPPALCTSTQPPPIFTLAAATNAVLDGNYQITVQGFDGLGVPGPLKTVGVTLNRFPPAVPCPLKGGYNKPGAATGNAPVVDFEWTANVERDIKGYRVYWTGVDNVPGNGNDVAVCGATTPVSQTFCQDTDPAAHGLSNLGDTAIYYVTAVDQFDSESGGSLPLTVAIAPNSAPFAPLSPGGGAAPDASIVSGQPTITWSIDPSVYGGSLDPDVLDNVIEYRVYRDGILYANRIAALPLATGGTTASFSDTNAGTGSHTYYVTAVDSLYQESAPSGGATP
jgi:prepilin-type N-terminal cleavage/methylation domain-containing protein